MAYKDLVAFQLFRRDIILILQLRMSEGFSINLGFGGVWRGGIIYSFDELTGQATIGVLTTLEAHHPSFTYGLLRGFAGTK